MKEQIYIATFSENAVSAIRENGLGIELNDLCISENLDEERIGQTIQNMKEEIRLSGLSGAETERVIVHGPFTEICPASIDHRAVSLGRERLEEAYCAVRAVGARRMVVHTGYIPLIYHRSWQLEKSAVFWKDYMKDKPSDFRLYIENVFEEDPLILRELLEALDDPRVKVCLDVGHANAVTLPEYPVCSWISALGPYIGHFHLHNNDGRQDLHSPVMEGNLDMEKVLEAVRVHCSPDVTMTVESRTCESSIRWLLERERRESGF